MYRNIRLFGVYKIFTKRLFLPLTTIYASQIAGLSIGQIGTITATAIAISILFETSSGHWADEHGRANSSRIGALLAAAGTMLYVVAPNYWGIMAAAILLAIGYAFLAGAMEALVHDSLVVLGEESNYAKIASRAQSLSLVFNAIFIATVPLLYPVDPRLPFILGVIAYIVLFTLASLLTEPELEHTEQQVNLRLAIRKFVNKKTIGIFLCVGFAYGIINGFVDILNLAIFQLGLEPQFTGLMFGVASITGALLGLFVHHLKRLTFQQFAVLDISITGFMFVCYGILQSLPLAIFAFVLSMSMWRYQKIMYQHYILEIYGHSRYKATLLSLFSNFGLIHEVWLILIFTRIASETSVYQAISWALPLLFVFLFLFLLAISQFSRYKQASAALPTH